MIKAFLYGWTFVILSSAMAYGLGTLLAWNWNASMWSDGGKAGFVIMLVAAWLTALYVGYVAYHDDKVKKGLERPSTEN